MSYVPLWALDAPAAVKSASHWQCVLRVCSAPTSSRTLAQKDSLPRAVGTLPNIGGPRTSRAGKMRSSSCGSAKALGALLRRRSFMTASM